MNLHYTYLLVLAGSLAGPLALSFDRKVAFHKKWRFLFQAMILPALFFIVRDIYFITRGVWGFNENRITGIKLYNIPVEEILFFFVVSYCCVFVYECIRTYFPGLKNTRTGNHLLFGVAILLLAASFYFNHRHYTSWTFLFTAVFIEVINVLPLYFRFFHANAFLFSFTVLVLPFLAVNGLLTAIPVVLYNGHEITGFRIMSIPFEDIFYGMLLFMMNIAGSKKLLNR